MKIFASLKNPVNLVVAFAVAVIFFDLNYYFITKLPGNVDNMCVPGGNINFLNISFAILISLMSSLMIAGVIELYQMRKAKALKSSALPSVGLLIGTFTVFCTSCSIPVISLFGLSVGLNFFTEYNSWFKLISLILMSGGLCLLNKQLEDNCKICKT